MSKNRLITTILFSILLLTNHIYGFKRYFRGDLVATNNNWGNANCWVRNSSQTYGQDFTYFNSTHPGGTNNPNDTVIFDGNSFPGSGSGANYINLNQTSNICRTIIFEPSVVTGANIIGSGILELHGSLYLQPNIGAPVVGPRYLMNASRELTFTGRLTFKPDAADFPATTFSIVTNNIAFANSGIYFVSEGNYQVIGNLLLDPGINQSPTQVSNGVSYGYQSSLRYLNIDIGNGVLQTNSTDTVRFCSLVMNSGTFKCNSYIFGRRSNSDLGYFVISKNSTAYPGSPTVCELNGGSNLMHNCCSSIDAGAVLSVGSASNIINYWSSMTINGKLNLKNATINFPYNTYIISSGDIISQSSILNLYASDGGDSYVIVNDTLNEVHVYENRTLLMYGQTYYKKLILEDGSNFMSNSGANNKNTIITGGTFEMKPGSTFQSTNGYNISTGSASAGFPNLKFESGTKFIASGTCNKRINIQRSEFVLDATTTYTTTNLIITSNRIVGAGAPYNSGTNSSVLGLSYGWAPSLPSGNTFYWQYPIATTSLVVTDTATYGNWHDVTNWSNTIGASPNTPMATVGCIPSLHDSVVFPNNSYVKIKEMQATCKSMTWLGTGVIAGTSDTTVIGTYGVKKLNIYGSLSFSSAMKNLYFGDVYFKAWQSYPTIKSSGKEFNRKIHFEATPLATGRMQGKWTLVDSIVAIRDLKPEYIGYGYGGIYAYNATLKSGELNTNNQNLRFNSFRVIRETSLDSTILTLNNSKVFLVGKPYQSNSDKYSLQIANGDINAGGTFKLNVGTSHIIFKSSNTQFTGTSATRFRIDGSGHIFNDVSFMDDDLNGSNYLFSYTSGGVNDVSFRNMDFYYNGQINHLVNYSTNKIHRLRTNINNPSSTKPFVISSLYNSVNEKNCLNIIDSAIYNGNANIRIPVTYNYLMKLSAGKIYNIQSDPINAIQKLPLATSSLIAVGTCVNPITINGGQFSSTVNIQSGTFLLVNSNTVTTNNFNYFNSVISNSFGWTGTPDAGRILHWKDVAAGNSTGLWNDPNMWEQLSPVFIAAPNCPPTPLDTVIFDNSSFTGISDTVSAALGSGIANCHTMKWLNTAIVNPVFKASNLDNIHIYGSLYFSKTMSNKHMGDFTFRGISPVDSIRSSGQKFYRQLLFNADAPLLKHWHIADSINSSYDQGNIFTVYFSAFTNAALYAGSLHTHGNKCTFGIFHSSGPKHRFLDLDTSKVIITLVNASPYGPYLYHGVKSFNILDDSITIKASKSTIILRNYAAGFLGGGHKYNKVISESGDFYYWGGYSSPNKDTINHLELKNPGNTILFKGAFIHKLTQEGANNSITLGYGYTGNEAVSRIDSFISKRNVIVSDSNHFVNLYHFEPGKSHTFPANKVNYFSNNCETKALGTPGNNVFIFSNINGQKAYWRKDSGSFCSNYCILQDNYAIGNGGNLSNPNPIKNNVLIDTILNSSLYDGPTLLPTGIINPSQSGRAKFLAGAFAINNGNSTKGWDFSPYAGVPLATLGISKDTICPGDSSLVTITLAATIAKVFPIVVYYNDEFGMSTKKIFNVSGSSPYSWFAKPTTGSINIKLDSIEINQCFNNVLNLTDSKALTVADPPTSVTPFYTANDTVCFNATVLLSGASFSTTTGGAATSYNVYSPINTNLGVANYSFIAAKDTTYWVEAINYKGCKSPKVPLLLKVTPLPVITSTTQSNVLCSGGNTGTAGIIVNNGTPGYTYNWSSNPSVTNSAAGFTAGQYTATVTDSKNCKASTAFLITEPTPIVITFTNQTSVSCFGGSDASVTALSSGGTPSYTYSWSPTSVTTNTISGLTIGTYTVKVKDTNNCIADNTITITQPSSVTVTNTITNVSCFTGTNGAIAITPSGGTAGYNYTWLVSGQTTSLVNGLAAGVYSVIVTDSKSCAKTLTYTVTQPTALLVAYTQTNVSCFAGTNGVATASVSGGTATYNYLWNPSGSTSSSASNLSVGVHSLTITDSQNCVLNSTVAIAQPSVLVAAASVTNETCNYLNNGLATASQSGGTAPYTYSWSPSGLTTSSISNLSSGTHSLYVTDNNGCVATTNAIIAEPATLNATILNTTQASCGFADGTATYTVSGGTAAYTYSWTTPSMSYTTTSSTTNSLSAGLNQLTVIDANSCTTSTNVTITNPNAPVISTAVTNINCFGYSTGVITTTVVSSNSYSYTWSNGSNLATQTNLTAGIYTVTVITINNCLSTQTVAVSQPSSAISLVISGIAPINCFGQNTGSVTTTAIGGTPNYSYLWSPGGLNSSTITNLSAGVYTLVATDNNGCGTTSVVTLNNNSTAPLSVTLGNVINATCEQSNGLLSAIVTGGSPVYNYAWSFGNVNNQTLSNIAEGTYTLTVTDMYGCNDSLITKLDCNIELFIPQLFSPNGDGQNEKFEIKGISNYPNNAIQIFNRWGTLVYSKKAYNNEWGGKPNVSGISGNNLLPAGTYFVVLDFGDSTKEAYKDYVQLAY